MADNIQLNQGTGGAIVKTFEDATPAHWPAGVVCYATTVGTPDVLVPVTPAAGLPVAQQGTWTITNAGTFAVQASQVGGWTVTANIGTAGTLALDATLTGGTQKTKLVDSAGTNVATVTAGGAVKVDGSAATQPVSGTFWQATQPISGTVTANAGTGTMAVSGTFWQATQPVSAASLPLPSGAATAAKQPALGTAGAASTDVITVQGIASGVAQPVTGTFWQATQPVSGTVTANAGTGTFAVSGAVTQSGTWNVGTVTTVTTVSAVTAITNALPAGSNLIGKVSASTETDTVYSGTTALTPKFAAISASSSGDNSVVAAVVGKKIRVLRWSVSSNGAVNAKWRRGTTDVTGLHYLTQFASAGGAFCPVGHFETAVNEALQINLSAAVAVGGVLTYIEV